jgi:hypothetical protein
VFDGFDPLRAASRFLRPKMALISPAVPKQAKIGPPWAADANHQLPFFDLHIRDDVISHAGASLARAVAVACTN